MASTLKPCRKCGAPFIGKYCKPCDNARSAARRKADPKKASDAVVEWKRNNRERARELNKLSYERNKESIAQRAKVFRSANRERLDEYNRAYEAAHPEVRRKIWRNSSKKKVKELSDSYMRQLLRLPRIEVPASLVEAKRITVQIKRFIKESK